MNLFYLTSYILSSVGFMQQSHADKQKKSNSVFWSLFNNFNNLITSTRESSPDNQKGDRYTKEIKSNVTMIMWVNTGVF